MVEKYLINVLSSDESGIDSNWIAEVRPIVYDSLIEAKKALKEIILDTLKDLNKHGVYMADTRTIDCNIEEFDTEVEIICLDENNYTYKYLVTRFSIQSIFIKEEGK